MKHEVVRTIEQWNALSGVWNDLLLKSRANDLFMTWQWLDTWLQIHDGWTSLRVVCVSDEDGQLRGLAPFYLTKYALIRTVPYRILRMIGDTNSGAEYQTWIAAEADEKQVFAEIVKGLRSMGAEWDLIWMPQLNTWSGMHEALIHAMEAGGLLVNTRPHVFSAISLPDEFDLYVKRMSSNRRQQTRRMSRKILGKPNVEIKKVGSHEELPAALKALFALHEKRWKSAGQNGVFVDKPLEKMFYERFAPIALGQGWLSVYVLYDGDEAKAVQLGYVYNGAFLQLQEGFDPDYSPHVGNVLRAFVIEDCIKSGCREYDFLGGTSEHKRRWLGEERIGMDLLASRPALKNLPIMRAGVWPTGAYLRPQDGIDR